MVFHVLLVGLYFRNGNACVARYKFKLKVSDFLANSVDVNALVRHYCCHLVSEDRMRLYQLYET